MKKILFICQANVGRSQMAEAFYNFHTQSNDAISAGAQDFRKKYNFHPTQEIVNSMLKKDIDISKQKIKVVSIELLKQAKNIIVFCDKSFCPDFVLENEKVIFHLIKDPHEQNTNTVDKIRDEIEKFIISLI